MTSKYHTAKIEGRIAAFNETATMYETFADDISAALARNYYKGVMRKMQETRRDEQLSFVETIRAHIPKEQAELNKMLEIDATGIGGLRGALIGLMHSVLVASPHFSGDDMDAMVLASKLHDMSFKIGDK